MDLEISGDNEKKYTKRGGSIILPLVLAYLLELYVSPELEEILGINLDYVLFVITALILLFITITNGIGLIKHWEARINKSKNILNLQKFSKFTGQMAGFVTGSLDQVDVSVLGKSFPRNYKIRFSVNATNVDIKIPQGSGFIADLVDLGKIQTNQG